MLLQSLQTLTLKLYGTNLLTPSANAWILLVRALIFGMAITEALSWGYAGRILIPGSWTAAILSGTVIFVFVWGVDASLMSLDRNERKPKVDPSSTDKNRASTKSVSENSPEETEGGEAVAERTREGGASIWQKISGKLFSGVAIRSILVTASLIFTAPFIALIVFETDIDSEIERTFSARVSKRTDELRTIIAKEAETRSKRTEELATELDEIGILLKSREAELNDEMRNPGTRGYGPIARKLEEQVKAARMEQQRKQAEISKHGKTLESLTPGETELTEFNTAIGEKNYKLLNDRWNIAADPKSYQVRNKIIAEKFESTPEFKRAERTIQAFLSFLFFGLAIMKIYEPRSTRIYFNAALQSDWLRFKAAAFDTHLRPDERSQAVPCSMTPFRFEEFMLDELPAILRRTKDKLSEAKLKQDHADGHQAIASLLAQKSDEIARLETTRRLLSETKVQLAAIESRVKLVVSARANLLTELDALKSRERGLRDKVKEDASDEFLDIASDATKVLHEKRVAIQDRLKEVEVSLSQLEEEQSTMTARSLELANTARTLTDRLEEIAKLQNLATKTVAQEIRRKFGK